MGNNVSKTGELSCKLKRINLCVVVKTNGNCDFEYLDMCNYTQDAIGNDETDWKLRSGQGAPYGNRPYRDHTTGYQG